MKHGLNKHNSKKKDKKQTCFLKFFTASTNNSLKKHFIKVYKYNAKYFNAQINYSLSQKIVLQDINQIPFDKFWSRT